MTSASMLLRGTAMLPSPQLDVSSQFARYAWGHSVASLPLLALGVVVQQLTGASDSIRYFFVMLLDPLATAIGVVLLFWTARRMFASKRLALALSLIYYFATLAGTYATQSWSEPLLATLLLAAFYALLRVFDGTEHYHLRWLLLAGAALSYAVFTKQEFAIPAFIFGLWWLARQIWELRREEWQRRLAILLGEGLVLGVPVLVGFGLDLWHNWVSSGRPFGGVYEVSDSLFYYPLWAGVYGLLISSGKGLVWFAPPLLLCLWAISRLWQQWRWEGVLVVALFLEALVFYGTFGHWQVGGNGAAGSG